MDLLSFPKELGEIGDDVVTVNLGRFGPYLKCGKLTATLPKDMEPTGVTFGKAEELLKETKEKRKKMAEPLLELGKDPVSGGEILVKVGRYGPYVTDGKTNASLSKKFDPKEITRQQALEILKKKRARGPGKRWKKKS